MKILVTGANGYIGSKVVKALCDLNQDVIATDLSCSHIDNRASFVEADVFSENDDWFSFFGKPDCCIHLAWRDGFVHDSDKHLIDLPKHFSFAKNLIDNGLGFFVSMGTMHEIGYHEGSVDENTPCNPLSLYGISKNALREALSMYSKAHNCRFMWLRAYYIFGDDAFGNSIFCKIRKATLEGKQTFPFTSGTNKYDFIHVDKLSKQIAICVLQDEVSGIINCCSGKPVSLREQVEWYIQKNNLPIKLDYGKYPDRPYDSPCIYGDSSKIDRILSNYSLFSKKIVITGSKGQLGFDCMRVLKKKGFQHVIGLDKEDVDIVDKAKLRFFFEKHRPDVVIHTAAWTSVDEAEYNRDIVFSVNVDGTKNIAECCKEFGSDLVYISTDYVFDGKGSRPFEVNDKKSGLSVYGMSKSDGEDVIISTMNNYYIVRISWAFGINGKNFVKTMIRLYKEGKKEICVVDDQIGSVTYTVDLASFIGSLILSEKYGVYHATNEGFISWADFAKEIFRQCNYDVLVKPVSSENYKKMIPNQANRPLNSRLSKASLDQNGFNRLPPWKDALERYLKEEGILPIESKKI